MPQTPTFAIKATNLTLTQDIVASVEKRFASLAKFIVTRSPDQEVRFQVEVGRKNKGKSKADDKFFVELDVLVSGERHRVVAQASEINDAIDEAKAEMTAHLSRVHERAKDDRRKGGRQVKEVLRVADAGPAAEPKKGKGGMKPKRPKKLASVKRVSPRSRKHGTKNSRGASNRPPVMVAPGRPAGGGGKK
jgi:ribosome-associated translation inhibitor RaiA